MKSIQSKEAQSFLLSRMKKVVEGVGSNTAITFSAPHSVEEIYKKLQELKEKPGYDNLQF